MATIIESALSQKSDDVKKLIYANACPHDFGYRDNWGYCHVTTPNQCIKCWNREAEESEEVCGK